MLFPLYQSASVCPQYALILIIEENAHAKITSIQNCMCPSSNKGAQSENHENLDEKDEIYRLRVSRKVSMVQVALVLNLQ